MNPEATPAVEEQRKEEQKLSRADRRRKDREIRRQVHEVARNQNYSGPTKEDIDIYLEAMPGKVPFITDGKTVLCPCGERHEIKKTQLNFKKIECDVMEISVKSRSRKVLLENWVKEMVKKIKIQKLENGEIDAVSETV